MTGRRYLCGVPKEECCGALTALPHNSSMKTHGSSVQAFKCHAKWLLRQGYTQVGNREFAPPDGGPIRVLTKKSRFGGMLRPGKRGASGAAQAGARCSFDKKMMGGIIF